MSRSATPAGAGWFDAGWVVFTSATDDSACYPPLDEREAQRHWLAGFGAAWVECPEEEAGASRLNGGGSGGESVEEALVRTLASQPTLLRVLWDLGLGKVPRVLN